MAKRRRNRGTVNNQSLKDKTVHNYYGPVTIQHETEKEKEKEQQKISVAGWVFLSFLAIAFVILCTLALDKSTTAGENSNDRLYFLILVTGIALIIWAIFQFARKTIIYAIFVGVAVTIGVAYKLITPKDAAKRGLKEVGLNPDSTQITKDTAKTAKQTTQKNKANLQAKSDSGKVGKDSMHKIGDTIAKDKNIDSTVAR